MLLLPVTVHGRVSDIWRGYIGQRIMRDIGCGSSGCSVGRIPALLCVVLARSVSLSRSLLLSSTSIATLTIIWLILTLNNRCIHKLALWWVLNVFFFLSGSSISHVVFYL